MGCLVSAAGAAVAAGGARALFAVTISFHGEVLVWFGVCVDDDDEVQTAITIVV